jgi:hypothetical protein
LIIESDYNFLPGYVRERVNGAGVKKEKVAV